MLDHSGLLGGAALADRPSEWRIPQPTVRQDGSLLSLDATLAAIAALFGPVALFVIGLGAMNRLLYPVLAFAAAIYLWNRRSSWYVGLCIWLFCAAPLIRRLTDLDTGWDPASPVLLAPYVACLVAGLSFLPYSLRARPAYATPFVVILVVVGYGVFLAAIDGRLLSGMVDGLKWSVGPLVAVHLLREADLQPAMHRAIMNSLLVAGPAMAAYGAWQFVDPSLWDRTWMMNVVSLGLDSIGNPAPFEIRVFSTMNSPSSFAAMLMVAMVANLGRPLALALPATTLMALGLALSQYRSMWAGVALGICYVFLAGRPADKARIGVACGVLVISTGLLALVPEMNQTITSRFTTLTELSSDASGQARLGDLAQFLTGDEGLILGSGVGIANASLDGQAVRIIDNGIIEIYSAFGIFGGTAFLSSMLAVLWLLFSQSERDRRGMVFYRAVVLAGFAQLGFVRAVVGESGFGMWVFMGLALSSLIHGVPSGTSISHSRGRAT